MIIHIKNWILALSLSLFFFSCIAQDRINHNNQELFLSGLNLAWVNFAQDLTSFNEVTFTQALNEIAAGGGNSMRWWLHVNGKYSPMYTNDSVTSISVTELNNMKKGLDLAQERGIGLVMCLWSFDMLQEGLTTTVQNRNLKMLEDTVYTKKYINNALIPIINTVGSHPAVICWEVFNEPEGMVSTNNWGWTPVRSTMQYVQQFINRIAGAIHQQSPECKVSNGSWSFQASTNVGGYKNYYSDAELISAGGDSLGTLDFYMVHYYDWGGTALSPFHHTKSYWQLDKPLVIGEFSARGPYPGVDPKVAYNYLYSNGYAGALSWTWTGHDGNGNVADASIGMLDLYHNFSSDIIIYYPGQDTNFLPRLIKALPDTMLSLGSPEIEYLNLNTYFTDVEDSANLIFSVKSQTKSSAVNVSIISGNILVLTPSNSTGFSKITVKATDANGKYALADLYVGIFDLADTNCAKFRKAWASSNYSYQTSYPNYCIDGLENTNWTSAAVSNQWIIIELEKEYALQWINLVWGSTYAREYEIFTSADGIFWTSVFHETKGDGGNDNLVIPANSCRFIKLVSIRRSNSEGIKLAELKLYESAYTNAINSANIPDSHLLIYPDPVLDLLYLKTEELMVGDIKIFSSGGKEMNFNIITSTNGQVKIDIADLLPGIYIILINVDNRLVTGKFVKS